MCRDVINFEEEKKVKKKKYSKPNEEKNYRNWDDRYHVLNVSSFLLILVFNSWLMMVYFQPNYYSEDFC